MFSILVAEAKAVSHEMSNIDSAQRREFINSYTARFILLCLFVILGIVYMVPYMLQTCTFSRSNYAPQEQNAQTTNRTERCDWADLHGAPFTADASNMDYGESELEQYKKYAQLKQPVKAGSSSDGYTYTVTLVDDRPASDGIFIEVKERFKNKPTSGGSSLTVYSEHLSRELCKYRDMFNGTYIVWCPPMALGGRRDITMKLQFVNFNAFAKARVTLNRHLWHHQIKLKTETPLEPINRPDLTTALGERMDKKKSVIWYQRKERWFVKNADGEHFFSLGTERMCACVRKMNRLIMVGASHMRHKFHYIVETCYNPGGKFPSLKHYKNMIYITMHYMEDSLETLMSVVEAQTTGSDTDMIFVQAGSWNLAFHGLKGMMDGSIRTYVDSLLAVRAKMGIPRRNFVVVTEPPFPMHESVTHASGNRNNYCIAATIRVLKSMLRAHDFNVYDEFAILRPQSESSICAVHYLCAVFDGRTSGVYGDVGIVSAKLMISHGCRGHDTLVTPCS